MTKTFVIGKFERFKNICQELYYIELTNNYSGENHMTTTISEYAKNFTPTTKLRTKYILYILSRNVLLHLQTFSVLLKIFYKKQQPDEALEYKPHESA